MSQGISAQGLSKRFGATQALDGVDLAVPAGTVLGLLGPNGAGKTTVVRILATLVAADGGTATVGGFDARWIAEFLLRLGVPFRVLGPDEVREHVVARLEGLLALQGDP